MKQLLIFFLCAFSYMSSLNAQTISYAYDASGNRISRTIVLSQRNNAPSRQHPTAISEVFGGISVTVSPNPTDGIVRVKIIQDNTSFEGTISVYTQSGAHIQTVPVLSDGNTVDLGNQPNGIYLLRIDCTNYKNTWKIIKK